MAAAKGAFPWKNASTLIVAARNLLGSTSSRFSFAHFTFNYQVMMLKRSAKSSFFAKAYVFPGGAVETADFSSSWLDVFACHGHSESKLIEHFSPQGKIKPPMYASVNLGLIPEIGFRIAAIREAFEETGILFCRTLTNISTTIRLLNDVSDWQKRIHENPEAFLYLCKEKNMYPDVWSLFEWSNWLTPAGMGGKRYDTIFYLCVIDQVPEGNIDKSEVTKLKWLDPVNCLSEHALGNIVLAPPQIYELSRMVHFSDVSLLKSFAQQRQELGTERWLPIRLSNENEITTILPGDRSYPKIQTNNFDIAAAESSGPAEENKVNRMVFSNPHLCNVHCNLENNLGHKAPMNLIPLINNEKEPSKL